MKRRPITSPYGYIYVTTNLVNGKRYIGQRTWSEPYKEDKYIGSGKILKKAIEKYGRDSFSKEIIDWANSKEELDQLEKFWIKHFDANHSSDFYNILSGGQGCAGLKWTDEQRAQASQRNKGENNPMYGKGYKLTGEHNGMYGKCHSEKTRKKMRESHKDVSGKNNPMYGANHPLAKGMLKLDKNKNIVAEYESVGEAARENNCYKQGIYTSCRTGKLYRGFFWMYKAEYSEEALERLVSVSTHSTLLSLKGENHSRYGKQHTEKTKKLLSEIARKLNQGENNPMYGKHHTEEARQKMSKARRQRANIQEEII